VSRLLSHFLSPLLSIPYHPSLFYCSISYSVLYLLSIYININNSLLIISYSLSHITILYPLSPIFYPYPSSSVHYLLFHAFCFLLLVLHHYSLMFRSSSTFPHYTLSYISYTKYPIYSPSHTLYPISSDSNPISLIYNILVLY